MPFQQRSMYTERSEPAASSRKIATNRETPTKLQCLECGKHYSRTLAKRTSEYKCPRCGSYDVDLA